ncbi:MAG: hypothetical protein E7369_03590 [Clostridiales bacterium]|nr:hypothetical protein [Clostridiales bacterium]
MQEPIFENISLNGTGLRLNDKLKVESRTDIPSSSIIRVLEINAFVSVTENKITDGSLDFGGNVIYQIFYQDDENLLKKYECGGEYAGRLNSDLLRDGDKADVVVAVDKTSLDVSKPKAVVTANISVTAVVTGNKNLQIVSGGEGLVVDRSDIGVVKSLGLQNATYPVKEEFELSYPVKEVLTNTVKCVVTNAQSGVGCVIADGEVIFNALLMKADEEKSIVKESRAFPFRIEIEYGEAMPTLKAIAKAVVKTFKTDISVDPDSSKSVVEISANLHFTGEVLSEDSFSLVTDAFSLKEDLNVERGKESYFNPCELISYTLKIEGESPINGLSEDCKIIGLGGERIEIVKSFRQEDNCTIEGVLSLNAYVFAEGGKKFSTPLETPFSVTLDKCLCCAEDCNIIATVKNSEFSLNSLSTVLIKAEVVFTAYPYKKECINYLKSITGVGEKKLPNTAFSVYIPLGGEDLWSMSKRLNVCPEELVALNKDLQFPLSGKERIVIYRQK